MDILGIKRINVLGEEVEIKVTNKSLYMTQLELKKKGLVDLFGGLDVMDLEMIFCLLKNSVVGKKVSIEDLFNCDIDIVDITKHIAESIGVLFNSDDSGGEVAEKK